MQQYIFEVHTTCSGTVLDLRNVKIKTDSHTYDVQSMGTQNHKSKTK